MAAGLALVLCVAACGSTVTRTVTSLGDPGDQPGARTCGVERWAVKVAADPAAGTIDTRPRASSIAALEAAPAPKDPTGRTSGVEEQVFAIRATLTAIKQEADRDYHLALSDGAGHTMIAESPDPACAGRSRFVAQLRAVRAALDQACPGVSGRYRKVRVTVDLTGVGFFDRIHGQLGVAPNGVELHPLLTVSLRGKC